MTANVMRMFEESRALPNQDRLLLARMLLDSLLKKKDAAHATDKDWQALSLSHFIEPVLHQKLTDLKQRSPLQ